MPTTTRTNSRRWLPAWSWPGWLLVSAAWAVPIAFTFQDGWNWWTGIPAILAFVGLHAIVWRRDGWPMPGPHFFYDVVRLARRGASARLRTLYLVALFVSLSAVYEQFYYYLRPNRMAFVTERFSYVLFLVQNLSVLILTPAYLGGAIAEERERRTLELLFTTRLRDMEIVLGILFSRVIHLASFVFAGLPILCLIQFWGGVDMVLLVGNIAYTLLLTVTMGSICILISTTFKTVPAGVACSYVLMVMACTCCFLPIQDGFVLQDARMSGTSIATVQNLPWLCVGYGVVSTTCLALAARSLQDYRLLPLVTDAPPEPWAPVAWQSAGRGEKPLTVTGARDLPEVESPSKRTEAEHIDPFDIPYALPPVWDDSLLWKERHLGRSELSPVIVALLLLAIIPVSYLMLMAAITLITLIAARDWQGYQQFRQVVLQVASVLYYLLVGCYLLGVAIRAASSVARERQQQTLDPLLLLPIDRRDILVAKWIGSLSRGWHWAAVAAADVAFALTVGAYHPVSAVLLCLAPWPVAFFFASLGLLISVTARTVLRANLVMVVVIIVFVVILAISRDIHDFISSYSFSWQGSARLPDHALVPLGFLAMAWILWRIALLLFEWRGFLGRGRSAAE